jgi:hypothetical protein
MFNSIYKDFYISFDSFQICIDIYTEGQEITKELVYDIVTGNRGRLPNLVTPGRQYTNFRKGVKKQHVRINTSTHFRRSKFVFDLVTSYILKFTPAESRVFIFPFQKQIKNIKSTIPRYGYKKGTEMIKNIFEEFHLFYLISSNIKNSTFFGKKADIDQKNKLFICMRNTLATKPQPFRTFQYWYKLFLDLNWINERSEVTQRGKFIYQKHRSSLINDNDRVKLNERIDSELLSFLSIPLIFF